MALVAQSHRESTSPDYVKRVVWCAASSAKRVEYGHSIDQFPLPEPLAHSYLVGPLSTLSFRSPLAALRRGGDHPSLIDQGWADRDLGAEAGSINICSQSTNPCIPYEDST